MATPPNRSALPAHPLWCLVTDRRRLAPASADDGRRQVVALAAAAARAGVDLIQVREPDLEAGELFALVRACVEATAGFEVRVTVNDRVDVALASGASGVHLRGDSPDASRVREIVPAGFLIGRSVHTAEEAARATQGRALDYLTAGTVYPTASKPGPGPTIGLDGLRRVVAVSGVPVLAIGGITAAVAGAVGGTGAAGMAAIGLFCEIGASVQELARVLETTRREFDRLGHVP
jgi:thiamine-phosphate pyrophosphorylase